MKDQETKGRDYYLGLYEDWKGSGLPVGLLCKQASLRYSTFRYWARKFNTPGNVILKLLCFSYQIPCPTFFTGNPLICAAAYFRCQGWCRTNSSWIRCRVTCLFSSESGATSSAFCNGTGTDMPYTANVSSRVLSSGPKALKQRSPPVTYAGPARSTTGFGVAQKQYVRVFQLKKTKKYH